MTNKPTIRNPSGAGLKEVALVQADVEGTMWLHGLYFNTSTLAYETTLAYTLTSPTRTLTITPTGASFRIWVKGVLYTFTGAQTISHAATQGLWFIYCDGTGTIVASQTPWNLLAVAPIALIYYDATTPDFWLLDERHHYDTPAEWHMSQHFAIGTFVKVPATDFPLSAYTLGTHTDAAVRWALGAGTVVDEDIEITTAVVAAGGPYELMAKIGAGGNFIRTQSTLPFLWNAGNRWLQYNQNVGGTWQLTDSNSASRVNYYIFGTTGYDAVTPKQIMIIPGQAIYSSLAAAQAESVSNLDLTQFPSAEYVPLYQITFHMISGNANNGRCEIEAVTKISSTRVSSGSVVGMTNPMTAAGDMIIGGASGVPGRLAIGPANTELVSDGTAESWQTRGANQRVLTADLTIADGMSYVVVGPLETNGHVLEIDGGRVGIF